MPRRFLHFLRAQRPSLAWLVGLAGLVGAGRTELLEAIFGAHATTAGDILVRGRRVTMGLCTGSSDLIGWMPVTVTPDMVGAKIACFVALEIKSASGRIQPEQTTFLDRVLEAGGVAVVIRSPEDIDRLWRGESHG